MRGLEQLSGAKERGRQAVSLAHRAMTEGAGMALSGVIGKSGLDEIAVHNLQWAGIKGAVAVALFGGSIWLMRRHTGHREQEAFHVGTQRVAQVNEQRLQQAQAEGVLGGFDHAAQGLLEVTRHSIAVEREKLRQRLGVQEEGDE